MSQPDPAPHSSPPILTFMPLLILGGILSIMVRRFAAPVTNPDTFFHLRLGEEFSNGWAPSEPESVTSFATADWVPTQWLSQLLYAFAENWAGLPGLAWLTGTVAIALITTFAMVARRFGGLLVAALVTVLAVFASAPFLSSRPQVASYLFIVLVTAAWLRCSQNGSTPWWTIPLTWLWAMVHGMWVSGIIIGLVAAVGLTLDRRADRGERDVTRRAWSPWLVPVLSLAAAGLTPVGPSIYSAAARVGGISEYFDEWSAPEFTDPTVACAGLMLGLVLLIGLRRGSQPWLDLSLLGLAAAWMAYAERSVPIAVAMLVPMAATSLGTLVPRRPAPRWESGIVLGMGVAASAVLAALVPSTSSEAPRHDSPASAAVAALPAGTSLLNDWALGGTDLWLYRDLQVVMHGYGDMFTDAELERNSDLVDLEPGWDDELRELGVEHALLVTDTPLTYALVNDQGWEPVAEDEELSYLVAPDDWLEESGR